MNREMEKAEGCEHVLALVRVLLASASERCGWVRGWGELGLRCHESG